MSSAENDTHTSYIHDTRNLHRRCEEVFYSEEDVTIIAQVLWERHGEYVHGPGYVSEMNEYRTDAIAIILALATVYPLDR